MKVAIFSGTIPSTTFVEHLIEGVSKHHTIYLFGTQKRPKHYTNASVKVYGNSQSILLNLMVSFFRCLHLVLRYPKRLSVLMSEVKTYKGSYNKRHAFLRLLPVVLHKPDIFHVQWAKDLSKWIFLKEKLDVKLILSLRGAHINYSPVVNKTLAQSYQQNFPNVDAFHAVSNAMKATSQKYNAQGSKIKVIHSPILKSTFNHYSVWNKNISEPIKIIAVGRFHWVKGYDYVLRACNILKENNVKFQLTFVSSNPVSEAMLFQIRKFDLTNEIRFINGLAQNELFQLMKTFDMSLLSSLDEGIANVVLESMAIGLPVISTNCGGMPEVVKHRETGWLIPIRDAQAMADAIVELSQTPKEDLKRITENAHHLVRHTFNSEESIAQFIELYESVITQNH
ncbi:glycosyltransferase family 4 protein [uncultured Psychroserpens sp.]|uniref:glycosyltransferase family 4 protein n=1 Tax=uncultured Psychroserpens sp. TaxID=255436 RepID=UPI00261074A7|nr:glycosyltransferase family 4 protein [uncultured Psychroserpens sp.]